MYNILYVCVHTHMPGEGTEGRRGIWGHHLGFEWRAVGRKIRVQGTTGGCLVSYLRIDSGQD